MSSHRNSLFSAAESSEPISESDEIEEIKHLLVLGDNAFHYKRFGEALQHYSNAYEIDKNNTSALACLLAVHIETGCFTLAQQEAERLVHLMPAYSRGHYFLGLTLENQYKFSPALKGFLQAIELDTDADNINLYINCIARVAQKLCTMPENFIARLPEMDPYKKLCEIGSCLYTARLYEECIDVLHGVEKVATNQMGITMKVQLTMANAHSALRHTDIAIILYEECLATAIATHDVLYQTKALVNISSLLLKLGDTHRAIVNYEKLLSLETDIRGDEKNAPMPDFWTFDLKCALYLNLSIAYKSIGGVVKALYYAQKYTTLLQPTDKSTSLKVQSFYNEGMLNEVLGNYQAALKNYLDYLKESKAKGSKRNLAHAYGCLGSVYAALSNHKLSLTYHEQHIAMVSKLKNSQLIGQAHEQLGDTMLLFNDIAEAINCYQRTIKYCTYKAQTMKATALSKIGKAYRTQKRFQHSIFYFEQALVIATDVDFIDLKILCELNLACILQYSTQKSEVSRAKEYLEKLIPIMEEKIAYHSEHDTLCSKLLVAQLVECYDAIIYIQAKYGAKDEALVYAESFRRAQTIDYVNPLMQGLKSTTSISNKNNMIDPWPIEKIKRVISVQNASVIVYWVLPRYIIIWLLVPVIGITKFYLSDPLHPWEPSFNEMLKALNDDLLKGRKPEELVYNSENRALPETGIGLKLKQKANKQLSETPITSKASNATVDKILPGSTIDDPNAPHKAARLLFDHLLQPINEELMKLNPGSQLIIIPDRALNTIPFGCLKDSNNIDLRKRFCITFLPNLLMLGKVSKHETTQLQQHDDLHFQRAQSRYGGLQKLLSPRSNKFHMMSRQRCNNEYENFIDDSRLNLKRISNPHLTRSKTFHEELNMQVASPVKTFRSKLQSMKHELKLRRKVPQPPRSLTLNDCKPLGSPTCTEKLVALHTMTTLTTRTSTNTDIIKSDYGLTEYVQVSDEERCLIIGSPQLPESLEFIGGQWTPSQDMKKCQAECSKIADILGVEPIVGEDATKDRFLKELQDASVIHIATYACLEQGHIVMSPNVNRHESGPPVEHSYLVTAPEIASMKLRAKLVILSCGWSTHPRERSPSSVMLLPTMFLLAGAQCVLTLLWPISNAALQKFYFHFYQALQTTNFVYQALFTASKQLEEDNRYCHTCHWAPFLLIGKDVRVDLQFIRHAMLDQAIDKVEIEAHVELDQLLLNPIPHTRNVPEREEQLEKVQRYIGDLMVKHDKSPEVLPEIIILLDDTLKRQHINRNITETVQLAECLECTEIGLRLLKFLGFHFQCRGMDMSKPNIIYPHWNPDELLVPVYDALRAMMDIVESPPCGHAIYELLPTAQDTISNLVDLLAISKHTSEVQLEIRDTLVWALWKNVKVKAVLQSLGFHQIGHLLSFKGTSSNEKLLTATLQLFIAMCVHKSSTLLYKMDVSLLGLASIDTLSLTETDTIKLPSLVPIVLPWNQVRMATPWMSSVDKAKEMDMKMEISDRVETLNGRTDIQVVNAKDWHKAALAAHGTEMRKEPCRVKTTKIKVKVKPCETMSSTRIPIDEKPKMGIVDCEQRRDYATFVIDQRFDNINERHRDDVRNVYLPYSQNVCSH